LNRRIKEKHPISAQQIWELFQNGWKGISDDYLIRLVERMPRVCKAIIKQMVAPWENK